MANSTTSTSAPRGGWLRRLGFIGAGLLMLLLVLYFVVTSAGFFKGFILPRVGKALNAQISVGDVSISPFSQVVLRDVKVQTTGTEPLVTAKELHARYHLWAILGGDMRVDEVLLESPVVNLVKNADGTSNLDPIVNAGGKDAKPAPSRPSVKPLQIDLKKLALNNGLVRVTTVRKDNGRDLAELSGVNVVLTDLKNGQTANLQLGAGVKLDNAAAAASPAATLLGKIAGTFNLTLTPAAEPGAVRGNTRFDVQSATGPLADLATLGAQFDCDVTPSEVKQCALKFAKGGTALGEVRAAGPFDLAKTEGQLHVAVLNIDRQVLNLAGAASGVDFGSTTIQSTNHVTLSQGGKSIAVVGGADVARFSISQRGQTTPALDIQAAYNVTANTADETARIEAFNLTGLQQQRPVLLGRLSNPMTLAWGSKAGGVGDAALTLVVTNLNLADWRAFTSTNVSAGHVQLALEIEAEQAGRKLGLDVKGQIEGLDAQFGDTKLDQSTVFLRANGRVTEFKQVTLPEYNVHLRRQGQPVVTLAGKAQFDAASQALDLQATLEPVLAQVLPLLGQPRLTTALDAKLSLDAAMKNQALDLRRAALTLTPTDRAPNNELSLQGRIDLTKPDAIRGQLKATAAALDVTRYYAAFSNPSGAGGTPATPPPPPSPTSAPSVEPASMKLPLEQFTVDVNIGKLFLRDIAAEQIVCQTKLDGSRVNVNPFQLSLNGAPMRASADLNLGVLGYQYDLSFVADQVPIEPIANSFAPDKRGQYKGALIADAKIKGAGTTGANLRKSLEGQFRFSFTNADIQIVGPRMKAFLTPIAVLVRAPEILQTPLNWAGAHGQMGSGKISLGQFRMVSSAFTAGTQGELPIADNLNQSPIQDWPMRFELRRGLAEKTGLMRRDTPPDATYAALPDFIKVRGTLNDPKPNLNEKALVGLAVEKVAEKFLPGLDKQTGGLLGNLGLGGAKPVSSNAPAGSSNAAPKLNPLDLFKRK